MNKSIFVPKELFKNKQWQPETICMYIYYGLNFSEDDEVIPFNATIIGRHLFGRKPTRTECQKIIDATLTLNDLGFLSNFNSFNVNNFELHFNYVKFHKDDYFFEIYKKEFFNILRFKTTNIKINSFYVLDTYLTIISNMNGSKDIEPNLKYKICTIGKELLIRNSHLTEYAFNESLKILKDNNILSCVGIVERGKECTHNLYSRYEDEHLLVNYAYKIIDSKTQYIGDQKYINSQRSITSLYNQMIKSKKQYPFYLAMQVFTFIRDYIDENPEQSKYKFIDMEQYMISLANDYLFDKVRISQHILNKYKGQIPEDYDDLKEAKQFLLDNNVEDKSYLDLF